MKKNTWNKLEGFPELLVGQYLVPNFMSNSVALHDGSGNWTIVSAGESLLAPWLAEQGGAVKSLSLILPNHWHYLGVDAWQKAYPDAKLYASRQASKRLKEQGFDSIVVLEESVPPLPQGYEVCIPPGHRGGDIWLCRRGTGESANGLGVWVTCDSFLNYERMSNQPIAKAMQKLLGAAPGLKMSQVVKWFILTGRREFAGWARERLQDCPPGLLIPAHGEPEIDESLPSRLANLISSRL